MNAVIFSEKQRFKIWWLWVVYLIVNGIFIFGFIKQVIFGQQFGDNPTGNIQLTLLTAFFLLFTSLCLFARLETEIKRDGVHYRFFPFVWRKKKISKEEISEAYIRNYNAIGDYLGWGMRFGLSWKDKAFILGGDEGIQLILTNNKRLLLGTRKPEEAKKALQDIGLMNPE